MEKRGEYLRIFDINHQKAPTLAEITLSVIEGDDSSNSTSMVVDWILKPKTISKSPSDSFSGLFFLRFSRSKLLKEIRKLPQQPTVKQQLKITSMRSRLAKEVKDFLQSSTMFLPNLQEEDLEPFIEDLIDTPAEEYVQPADPVNFSLDDDLYHAEDDYSGFSDVLESIILPPPSNVIQVSVRFRPALNSLISIERELQKGQANDALEGLQIGLAHKSLLLLNDVNNSTSTKQSTLAWASVRNSQSQILHHALLIKGLGKQSNRLGQQMT